MMKFTIILIWSFFFIVNIFITNAELAEIYNEENLDFDRDYRDQYLMDHNYFSDIGFVITSNGDKLQMATSTTSEIFKGINVNGKKYAFHFIGCDAWERHCVFRINGVPTGKIYDPNSFSDKKISFKFDEDYTLKIENVKYATVGAFDVIDFLIEGPSPSCGDNICNEGETCSSCIQDCGCQAGYICESDQCIEEVICGDNKCSSGETCIEDNCCNGNTYDLNSDNDNCGSCGNVCFLNQACISRTCINQTEYCGDDICNLNENCGTCTQDCSCTNNTKCESNQCVTFCGNSVCEANEEGICKVDCQWCGDNSCNNNETYETCPKDCKTPVICGDGICDNNENCCLDCGCETGYECVDNFCVLVYECLSDLDCNNNEICSDNECVLVEENETNILTVTETTVSDGNKTQSETTQPTKEQKNILQKVVDWILGLFR